MLFMQAIVGGAVPAVPVGVLMPDLIWTSYDVASGTQGGAATPSVWTTRPLNTLHHDDVGVSLASNRISLPAGTYAAVGQFATYNPEKCLHRLYDATNAVELVRSTGERRPTHTGLVGMFTLAAAADVELQIYSDNATVQNQRMGWAVGEGGDERFASLLLEKVS